MNNIFKLSIIGAALTLSLSSCNDWLDVRPDTEQKEKDQFATEKGFQNALTGCYMDMASTNAYGMRLTMSNVENMANLWYIKKETSRKDDYELSQHDYKGDNAKAGVKALYNQLFKTIAQANLIIKNAELYPSAFKTKGMKEIVTGEAYALRAYCQFDVLRMFGQMPDGSGKQVRLPYSETTSIDQMPAYYSFGEYTAKLKADLEKAEALLKEADPAMKFSFEDMNYKDDEFVTNDFLLYRQMRLNYWAVRALHARMALYTGDKATAAAISRELIGATLPDGWPVRELSGAEDYNEGYTTCPNECYFSLSKYDIKDVAASFFTLNDDGTQFRSNNQALTTAMLADLYAGENVEAHNRYNGLWNRQLKDTSAKLMCGFKRYCFADDTSYKALCYQIIPMLRVSEMYLIAIETSTDMAEINDLYAEYMMSHNVMGMPEFESLEDVKTWLLNEYRREFYGEGQMFYTYKRMGAKQILWMTGQASEATYIIPLPETEYDPNL